MAYAGSLRLLCCSQKSACLTCEPLQSDGTAATLYAHPAVTIPHALVILDSSSGHKSVMLC